MNAQSAGPSQSTTSPTRRVTQLGLIAVGIVIGHWHASQPSVSAQQAPQPQAFLSGSERCEIILKDMHKTLQVMDQRLATLEKATLTLTSKK